MDRKKLIPKIDANSLKELKGKYELKGRKIKRKVKGGAAAGAISAGLLLSGLFGSPAELTGNEQNINNRPAVVQMVDMEAEDDNIFGDETGAAVKKKSRFSEWLKQKIQKIPIGIRAVLGVPLWAIGWTITFLISLLWKATGAVVLPFIIKLVLFAVFIFAIIFVIIKLLNPDMPAKMILKKMFKKRNWIMMLVGAVVLAVADSVLISAWKDYGLVRWIVIFVIGLVILFLILRFFKQRNKKRDLRRAY